MTSHTWHNRQTERSPLLWAFPMVSLFLCARVSAQTPPDLQIRERQVKTLARVLAYDDNLAARAGSRVVLVVLYKAGNPDFEKEATGWFTEFSKLESYKVRGLPFHAVMAPFTSEEALDKATAELKAVALFVCPSLEDATATIKQFSQKHKTTTIGSREEQVTDGLALGVFSLNGKLVVEVNLPASRAEGAKFDSDLLRLAKVIQ